MKDVPEASKDLMMACLGLENNYARDFLTDPERVDRTIVFEWLSLALNYDAVTAERIIDLCEQTVFFEPPMYDIEAFKKLVLLVRQEIARRAA